jgi:hypothetical protein
LEQQRTVRREAPHMKVKRLNLPYKQVRLRRTVQRVIPLTSRIGLITLSQSKHTLVVLNSSTILVGNLFLHLVNMEDVGAEISFLDVALNFAPP